MYPSSLHIIYMIIILSCINALYVLLSYTFCFDVLAFLFFHALSISVQDQWSFTNLRAWFFFWGGGGRTVQQQQRHPVTATGESIVWYHGDPWAGCRAAIPWGLAQGELVGHWVVRDDRDGVRDVESLNVMNLKACNRLGEFEGEFSKINFATLGISFVSFVTPAARA